MGPPIRKLCVRYLWNLIPTWNHHRCKSFKPYNWGQDCFSFSPSRESGTWDHYVSTSIPFHHGKTKILDKTKIQEEEIQEAAFWDSNGQNAQITPPSLGPSILGSVIFSWGQQKSSLQPIDISLPSCQSKCHKDFNHPPIYDWQPGQLRRCAGKIFKDEYHSTFLDSLFAASQDWYREDALKLNCFLCRRHEGKVEVRFIDLGSLSLENESNLPVFLNMEWLAYGCAAWKTCF